MLELKNELKNRYEEIAKTGNENATASDFLLRELEIECALKFIRDGDKLLDVGCGPGVALEAYVKSRIGVDAFGIDYAHNMVDFARSRLAAEVPEFKIDIKHASVTDLPFENNSFNVVTSHRCLMALLDWELQKQALVEIHRILKPGGIFVMLEGTMDGLDKLNSFRRQFQLSEIDGQGKDNLFTLKFDEQQLLQFTNKQFELLHTQRFGMYYFLTRIVQPLLVAPNKPSYDHTLNLIAKQIAKVHPDFEGIGHLVGFVFRKKS